MMWFRKPKKLSRATTQRVARATAKRMDHPFHALEDPIRADYRGIPTHECPCGSNWILMCAVFDPDTKLPGFYMLDGMCASCGALLTIATPVDEWSIDAEFG